MNALKRFLIVAKKTTKRSGPDVEIVHAIEWYGSLEELERGFNEVFGKSHKIVEIMQTVRHFPDEDFVSPFREWLLMG